MSFDQAATYAARSSGANKNSHRNDSYFRASCAGVGLHWERGIIASSPTAPSWTETLQMAYACSQEEFSQIFIYDPAISERPASAPSRRRKDFRLRSLMV